ncbi:hypothetical protein [Novosphingobium sp.]|uniref:hypothetical protein n=1 Tax=Novosphingobium sp. TaxID=1874826 RepID=UPI00286DA420|nr:hypothetical protein [Novosphingobium sp.]
MPYLSLHQPDPEPTCTLPWVRLQLGAQELTSGRLVRYVGLLIAERGFPPPLPNFSQRTGLSDEVTKDSRWIRSAVEAWLLDFLPPANAGAVDAAAMKAAAAEMDAAAGNLRLIQGGRP